MTTKYSRFHFGDVVVNKFAKHDNQNRIGMVTHVDVVGRPALHLSDGKGRRWTYEGPDSWLEIVGRGRPENVCP